MRYRIHKKTFSRRRKYASLALLFAGIILAVFAVLAMSDKYKIGHSGVPSAGDVSTSSNAEPSEQAVPANYSVPANQPLAINLPTISTKAFIQKISVDKSNQMAVPTNIHMAGWYIKGAKPGEKGLSIIDGHYSGRYQKAAFADLKKLKTGDKFTVEYGDHHSVNFEVKNIRTMSISDVAVALFERDKTIEKQLNLITCGGKYLPNEKTFYSRILVVARATE